MAETSPDQLWSPDAGDQFDWVAQTALMQDTVQDALTAIRNDPDLVTLVQPLPQPVVAIGDASTSVTAGAGVWQNISGNTTVSMTPARDLWVDVFGSAVVRTSNGGYVMIGVSVNGLDPYLAGNGTTNLGPGIAPFSSSPYYNSITSLPKRVKCPAGQTTSFTLKTRRSVGTGDADCNYSLISVQPIGWAL